MPELVFQGDKDHFTTGALAPDDHAGDVPDDIRELAERRWQARLTRDWAASDAMRDELAALGWAVKDARDAYSLERKG